MIDTNVPDQTLNRLTREWDQLTPEAQKAARFVLENPAEIGVSTIREIARAADVKPNTLVRMARQIGFEGYDDFREPFRDAIKRGQVSFPDRARWLQEVRKSGALGSLYAELVSSAISSLEESFSGISPERLKQAAESIWSSRNVYTLGVGVNYSNAANFTYLASTGMIDFHALPNPGSTPADDIAWADHNDVLIAITHSPYRKEVLDTVEIARNQGLKIIAISDSPASPIIISSDHGFTLSIDTPSFFPSSVSTIALLEILLSFVIASADEEIVKRVETFHNRRHELGLYQEP